MQKVGILTLVISLLFPLSAFSSSDELLKAANPEVNGAYTRTAFLALNNRPFDDKDTRKKLLILGDSHAQDFLNTVKENNYLTHYQIRTHYIPTRCQIAFKAVAKAHIEPKDQAFCEQANELEKAKALVAKADVLIVVGRWRNWAAKLLPNTLEQLAIRPNQKVIVLGTKDFGRVNVRNYLRLPTAELVALKNKVDPVPIATNQVLSQNAQRYSFINQQQLICGSTTVCPLFTEQGALISYDGGHLTPAGAKWVGQRLFKNSLLGKL